MRKLRNLSFVVLVIAIAACAYNASMVKTSYNILATSQASYDTSMKVAKDLKESGQLAGEDLEKVREAAGLYYMVHNTAVEALAKYEESKDSADLDALEMQIGLMSEALIEFLKILGPFIGG